MTVSASIGNLIKIAVLGAFIYAVVKWDFNKSQDDDNSAYAERVCADAIRDRFDTRSVNVYRVSDADQGFVVRASITTRNGSPAKVYCLTNTYGGVEEIRIVER
jgi:hypothetical protein